MLSKPFKPPLIRKPAPTLEAQPGEEFPQPPAKRRRVSDEAVGGDLETDIIRTFKPSVQGRPALRKPLAVVRNPPSPEEQKTKEPGTDGGHEGYYMVLWRKFTLKKNKTWDGDGVLAVRGGYAALQDISGSQMGRTAISGSLEAGSTLSVGGKDVEVDSEISKEDFLAGRPFLKSRPVAEKAPPKASSTAKAVSSTASNSTTVKPKLSLQAQLKAAMAKGKEDAKKTLYISAPATKASQSAFKNPLKESTTMRQVPSEKPQPRHDANAPGALVFMQPRRVPKDRQVVDVVLDPLLGKHLREHQREGVKFLYECVMGYRGDGGEGAILADEMGLGKTLQTIALLWTLLKQNPVYKSEPVIKKALIVCPVTLIGNWRKEFRKWLGDQRIGVYVADGTRTKLSDFTMGSTYQVMIIGYERLRSVAEDLTKGSGIDIVIADEGHRLKTEKNKSAKAIQSLNTAKRIILSGTPIQNDLSEFFVMANFVNDGCLGTYKSFIKNFETPILRSRQPNALEKDIELGEARSEELAQTTSPFILRRTAEILSKYLPPKTEYVLFCSPTPEQAHIYRHVITSPMFQSALGNAETALQLITILKKLCNSPSLLVPRTDADKDSSSCSSLSTLIEMLPQGLSRTFRNQASTKIRMLDQLLHNIRNTTDEKVVVVSNYTSTLDLIAALLSSTALPFLRLDGSTPTTKRQSLVDEFNRSKPSHSFAFLLSAKAGGLGLNLIGASRLILFDVDWNPAVEEQAMARIHRQGQKRECKIYRFVVKGGLEERIWQRQVVKRGLADSIVQGGGSGAVGGGGGVVPGKKGVAAFSREELRDLFRLDENEGLRTHDLIGCDCRGRGIEPAEVLMENSEADVSGGDPNAAAGKGVTDEYQEESKPELPDFTTLTSAARFTSAAIEEQERKIAAGTHPKQAGSKKKGKEMSTLMEYVHIDTTNTSALVKSREEEEMARLASITEMIDDECLTEVLRQQGEVGGGGGIAWVFRKTSGDKMMEGLEEVKLVEVKSSFFN